MATSRAEHWAKMKEKLKQIAPELGIDKIGFASAAPFVELKERLINHREKGFESGFEEPDLEKRVNPALLFDQPQSIIAIAVAYPSHLQDAPRSKPGQYRGIISRAAWGEDYHHVLRDRLDRVEEWLTEHVAGVRVESMVDTGALADRAVAERAGLGWSAKNCFIITPEWGSWVFLGEMITNIPFPPDTPVTDQCGECTKCIDACPTGALVGPGQLNAQSCISFQTQTKGIVTDEMKSKIGTRLYGCDTCQVVCPKNKGLNWTHQPEFEPEPEIVKPLLLPLLELSNRQFRERFGHSAAAWRGKNPIQRNAVIALGHYRDRSAIDVLAKLVREDARPAIRDAAAWALGRIGGDEAYEAIIDALEQETDEEVLGALHKAREEVI